MILRMKNPFVFWISRCVILGLLGMVMTSNELMAQTNTPADDSTPNITYSRPTKKVIAGIELRGNKSHDESVVINVSGLRVGQRVEIPGEEITMAVQRYLRNGFFSDVSIEATKMEGDSVWLAINITERPRLSKLNINGVRKTEGDELRKGKLLALQQGVQVTPNMIDRAELEIKRYFDEKGFSTASVETELTPDSTGYVVVDFNIRKNSKTRIERINFIGNEHLSDSDLRKAMKKTNERFNLSTHTWNSILEIFGQKKFVEDEYKADLNNIIDKYHQHGFRDAEIVRDTVYWFNDKRINIDIEINEGKQYFIKDINFVGNTKYATDDLKRMLDLKVGDVYDQKKLNDRLVMDQDALTNIYSNSGYLFAYITPIETEVKGDSVALDIRIHEGKPARINKVIIRGNSHVYDEVVRRELYTKPGMLFNRDFVMRSMMQLRQMGHFDPERIVPDLTPNESNGTVDIAWQLEPKSNDQFELSFGWSQTGLIFSLGLKFTNFSMRNLFNKTSYSNFLPRGDGQTLSLRYQTNAKYYKSFSFSFMDPWFGRKRPNMLSLSAYYSRQTDINRNFFNAQTQQLQMMNPYGYGMPYGGYGYGGYGMPYGGFGGGYGMPYGGYGYGNHGYGYGYDMAGLYESAFDPDKTMDMLGLGASYGKRLSWPDDNFQIQLGLNYTMYRMKNWSSSYYNFGIENGTANDINLNMTLARSSTDNPIYTRTGSEFVLNASSTLPYSLFDKIDYSDPNLSQKDRYRFIEYYKLKGKGQVFIPLLNPATNKRTPVLMFSAESGIIGSYNKFKRSPFGTYYMGGDGMSSYYGYLNEMVGLRGYKNGSISGASGAGAYAYYKIFMELRYPIISEDNVMIWAHAFAEAGNAWQNIQDMNPFQLKRSAGLGVRVHLPMGLGLVGLDWGYGFDKPDGSNTKGGSNLHFVLGQQF